MLRQYRVCCIQVETGRDPEKNLGKLFSLLGEAARARPDFIVLPEMFEIAPDPSDAARFARSIPGELTERLAGAARRYSVNVIGGTIIEREGDSLYNTSVVFDRQGELCGKYRKLHLFDAFSYGESNALAGGKEPFLCTLDGLPFGIAVCYDVRFPELFRFYAVEGAQAVFVPSAFFQPNHDHWELGLRSRAVDNGIFLVGCNQTGKRFVGRSMVVNPWGVPVASMGIEEGFFCAELDLTVVEKTREKLPLLENRRFDVLLRP